jgi:hypothetical protein
VAEAYYIPRNLHPTCTSQPNKTLTEAVALHYPMMIQSLMGKMQNGSKKTIGGLPAVDGNVR